MFLNQNDASRKTEQSDAAVLHAAMRSALEYFLKETANIILRYQSKFRENDRTLPSATPRQQISVTHVEILFGENIRTELRRIRGAVKNPSYKRRIFPRRLFTPVPTRRPDPTGSLAILICYEHFLPQDSSRCLHRIQGMKRTSVERSQHIWKPLLAVFEQTRQRGRVFSASIGRSQQKGSIRNLTHDAIGKREQFSVSVERSRQSVAPTLRCAIGTFEIHDLRFALPRHDRIGVYLHRSTRAHQRLDPYFRITAYRERCHYSFVSYLLYSNLYVSCCIE